MRVLRLGSRTGSRPVRKSFGECCPAFVSAEGFDDWKWLFSSEYDTSFSHCNERDHV